MWGTDGVARELAASGVYPYMPLHGIRDGQIEVIYGTSETCVQGTMVTSGTIIVSFHAC